MGFKRIFGATGAAFMIVTAVGLSRDAAADVEATPSSVQTNSVGCDLPTGLWTVDPGGAYSHEGVLSGFAGGTYYVTLSKTGNATWNEGLYTYPGFTASNGTQGFFGPSTNLLFGFNVFPNASPGSQSQITVRVIDTAGRTICQNTMTARVAGGCTCIASAPRSPWALMILLVPLAILARRRRV